MALPVVLAGALARKFGPEAAMLLIKLLRGAMKDPEVQAQLKVIVRSRDPEELKRNLKALPKGLLTEANLRKVLAACSSQATRFRSEHRRSAGGAGTAFDDGG
ncbi:MAG: hypothetical protein ACF8TS_15175 [Maioricimonas sp. JB049]